MEDLYAKSRELRGGFEKLIKDYRQDLWRYCLALTRTPWDAEDLSQDTIVKAFGQLNHLYQVVNPRAYLLRMASNLWIDKHRKSFREEIREVEAFDGSATDPIVSLQVWEAMEELIQLLTPAQRVTFLLSEAFEFRNREIADLLSLTEGGVKSLLHRARRNLRTNGTAKVAEFDELEPKNTHNQVVDAYVSAFNSHDPRAIAALLDDTATVDIYGVSYEYGKDTIIKASLADWAKDPLPMRAEHVAIMGEPTIIVYGTPENKPEGISTLIRLDIEDGKITRLRDYYFCPELITYIATYLDVPAYPNGTFWK